MLMIQSLNYGIPEMLKREVSSGLEVLSVDPSKAITVTFPFSRLLLEPLSCGVASLSLLYIAWQVDKADTFYITKTRRNSLLIMLEGSLDFGPSAGKDYFTPFTLLQGQLVWMPMDPVDYYFAAGSGTTCRLLELHYSANLLRNLEIQCGKGSKPARFKCKWHGLRVQEALEQLLSDPLDARWSLPLYEKVQQALRTKIREPLSFSLPFVEALFAVRKHLQQHYREELDIPFLLRLAGTNENQQEKD